MIVISRTSSSYSPKYIFFKLPEIFFPLLIVREFRKFDVYIVKTLPLPPVNKDRPFSGYKQCVDIFGMEISSSYRPPDDNHLFYIDFRKAYHHSCSTECS